MITFYKVHKHMCFKDTPVGRIDTGEYYYEQVDCNDLKDVLLEGSEMCEEYIVNCIFLKESEAKKTVTELNKLLDKQLKKAYGVEDDEPTDGRPLPC